MDLLVTASRKLPSRPQYKNSVKQFLEWNESGIINEETLLKYFSSLKGEYSPSTIRLSKAGIKYWILETHHNKNDIRFRNTIEFLFKEIKVPKPQPTIQESKILSENELQVLMESLPVRYSLILEALYQTGSRISELLSIRLKDCKKLKDFVEIHIVGKRGKEGTLTLSKELFDQIKNEFKGKKFLFENKETEKPLTRQIVHRHLQKAGFEIDRVVFPHQLRHSRITHLLKSGKPLDSVSRFARHFDAGFTAKAYGHNMLSSQEIIETSLKRKI